MSNFIKYKKIKNVQGRTFVVGDIHGSVVYLIEELVKIEFDFKKDILICTGDLIDRGLDSLGSLKLLEKSWFKTVQGNHEQMALHSFSGDKDWHQCWMKNGGGWVEEITKSETAQLNHLLRLVCDLPLVIETIVGGVKFVICHADYPSNVYEYNKQVDSQDIIWNRDRYTESFNNRAYDIAGADLFIFGHTPVATVEEYGNQMYIDTGAVFTGGYFTILELNKIKKNTLLSQ